MRTSLRTAGLAAAALAAMLTVAGPAMARPWHHHRHGYGGAGAAFGFFTGALIGGALASRPYYGPYAYGPGYGAYAYSPGYVVTDDSADVQYCMQRFKSYDPARGTYLGYDGIRHPCP